MTDLPLIALHGFGLAFLWSVLTCAGCCVAALCVDFVPDPPQFERAVESVVTVGLCGIIVSGAGVVTCGAWLVMEWLFGG